MFGVPLLAVCVLVTLGGDREGGEQHQDERETSHRQEARSPSRRGDAAERPAGAGRGHDHDPDLRIVESTSRKAAGSAVPGSGPIGSPAVRRDDPDHDHRRVHHKADREQWAGG
jgi:hypothetical protein